ncbi:MAG: asparagine synthase-related protein, partial [Tepidisphaeraceae bacterium]
VANLAQKAQPDRPVNTFTLAFEEASFNEGEYARAIAKAIGTNHREILLTESSFVKNLDTAIETLDQPTFDGLNSYYMSKAVREAGLTVALVGTGGDELFGGYTTFRYVPTMLRWSRRSAWMPKGAKLAMARLVRAMKQRGRSGAVAPQTKWAKLPAMVDADDDRIALYQLSYALFLPDFQRELLAPDLRDAALPDGLPPALHERLVREVHHHSPLSAISVMEQRCFLGERLLRDTDAASMASALELRVPLVDQVLTAHVNRLSDNARYAPVGRKQALRDAGLEGLDPGLFDRPKSGFVLPFDRWIRQNLGTAMDQTMNDARAAAAVGLDGAAVAKLWRAFRDDAPGMYWSRVWAIYVLLRWCHRHGVLL